MKKILHVVRTFKNGGTEKYILNLISHTYDDYDNYLLVYDEVKFALKELNDMNVKIITIDSPDKTGLLENFKKVRKVIKRNNINIVYSYTHYNSAIIMLAAFFSNVKIRITHSHRSSTDCSYNFKYLIYRCVCKILITLFSTKKLSCGIEASKDLFYGKSKIINNGIEFKKYEFNELKRKKIRTELNIPDDYEVWGNIGRIDDNKNQDFLIEIFDQYYKVNKKIFLLVIGEGNNKKKLMSKVDKLNLSDNVLFLGEKENANEFYNAFDIFLFPSLKEGLPFTLIEAQINGLNCVVNSTVDKNSNITGNLTFIDVNNKKRWINVISQKVGKRYNRIDVIREKKYSIDDTVEEIKKIYDGRR